VSHRFLKLAVLVVVLAAVGRAATARVPTSRDETRLTRLFNTGLYDSVLTELPPLEARASALGDSLMLGRYHFQRGRVLITTGRQAEASHEFDAAIRIAEAHADTLGLLPALHFKAYVLRDGGNFDQAMACFERELDLARRAGIVDGQVVAMQNLAYRDVKRGDLERARQGYDEVLRLLETIDRPDIACGVYLHVGLLHRAFSDPDEARRWYRRAWELARTHTYRLSEIFALNNLGYLDMEVGNWDQAVRYLERSRELADAIGFTRGQALATLNLSEAWSYLGENQRAMEMMKACLAVCERSGYVDMEEMTTVALASKHLDVGRNHTALRFYRSLLDREFVFEAQRRTLAAMGISEALASVDSLDAAVRVLAPFTSAQRDAPEEMVQSLLDLQYASLLERLERHAEALPVAESVREIADASGRTDLGVSARIIESQCRHGLNDTAGAVAALHSALDSMEVARVDAGSAEWREAFGAHVMADLVDASEVLLVRADGDKAAGEREFYDLLQRVKARTLEERVRDPRPGGPASQSDARTLASADALQRDVLAPGDILIDIFAGREHVWVFGVTRGALRVHRIPDRASELAERVGVFRDVLASPAPASHQAFPAEVLATLQATLGETVLGAFANEIAACNRLIVAPDGFMASIPFGALRVDGVTLLDRMDVSQVPSAGFLMPARDPGAGDGTARVVVMAAHSLPGAAQEADLIARRYGASGELGIVDVAALARGEAGDVLHIAGHARVNDDSPWQSGFYADVEAPANAGASTLRGGAPADSTTFSREFATGPVVRAWEIARTRLPYALAVLAGCETAGGRRTSGEGVLGLTSAFVSAGVPVVVSSLWPVDDAATARLMTAFYDELARGKTVATALRLAQAAVRSNPSTSHPFYWAGFTVVGDGARVIPIQRVQRVAWLWIATGVATGCLAGAWVARNRRRAGSVA